MRSPSFPIGATVAHEVVRIVADEADKEWWACIKWVGAAEKAEKASWMQSS